MDESEQPSWRQEALEARLPAYEASKKARDDLIRMAFAISKDFADSAAVEVGGQEVDEAEATAFIAKWDAGEVNLNDLLPAELPSLSPTPPGTPDSNASDAIAEQLIAPEHREERPRPPPVEVVASPVEEPMAVDLPAPASIFTEPSAAPKVERSKPIDRRSPSFREDAPPEVATPATPLPATISPAFLFPPPPAQTEPSKPPTPMPMETQGAPKEAPLVSAPVHEVWPQLRDFEHYTEALPPLPFELHQKRQNVGGLFKQKLQERPGLSASSALAGGGSLFKLGISKAQHMSLRQVMGVGSERERVPAARNGKVITSRDWKVGIDELKMQRVMERIEQVKAENNWSLKQMKKQKGPFVPKAHWDYVMDEMRWMRTDFREERKWKLATAHAIARDVVEWFEASEEERQELVVRTGPPRQLAEESEIMDVDPTPPAPSPDPAPAAPPAPGLASSAASSLPPAARPNGVLPSSADPNRELLMSTASERTGLTYDELLPLRAPIFHQPLTRTIIPLEELPVATNLAGTAESQSPDLLHLLFNDMPLYDAPILPPEGKIERRVDESNPTHSRITPLTKLLDSKPYLLSTLEPAKKRRKPNEWEDMSHLIDENRRELESKPESLPIASVLFAGRKPKEMSHGIVVSQPPPPAGINVEERANMFDWTAQEDTMLLVYAKQYAYNWHLICEVFNGAAMRTETERRLPWDMWDRWNRKFNASANVGTPAAGPSAAGALAASGASSDAVATAQQAAKARQKSQRSSSRLDGPKIGRRSGGLVKVIGQLQRKRDVERQQKQRQADKPRVVNLSAHETHNINMAAVISPSEMGRLKAERDKAEQSRRAQQQAALFQQHEQAKQAALAARYPQLVQQAGQLQQQQRAVQDSQAAQQANGAASTPTPSSASQANGTPRLPGSATLPAHVNSPAPPRPASAAGSSNGLPHGASPRLNLANLPPGTPAGGRPLSPAIPPSTASPRPGATQIRFNDLSLGEQHRTLKAAMIRQRANNAAKGLTEPDQQEQMVAQKMREIEAELARQQASTSTSAGS